MSEVLTTPATTLAISVADFKQHARIDSFEEDDLIEDYIQAASRYVEDHCQLSLINQTYTKVLADFPSDNSPIRFSRRPVQSVTSVAYTDSDGTSQTLTETTDYLIDTDSYIGSIRPATGQSWPAVQARATGGVVVNFVAGHGTTAANVPTTAAQAVRLLAGHWYENRESVVIGTITSAVPFAVQSLLMQLQHNNIAV